MKKFFAVTSAAVLAASLAFSFSSCSDKSGSSSTEGNLAGGELGSDVNVSQEDLPYGATIMQLTPDIDGVPIMTEIDDRFLSTEEGTAVSEYFGSFSKRTSPCLKAPPTLLFWISALKPREISLNRTSLKSSTRI